VVICSLDPQNIITQYTEEINPRICFEFMKANSLSVYFITPTISAIPPFLEAHTI
jgi:hypothetical protein